MIALLLLQSLVVIVPMADPPRELTPASRTKPIEHYECRLVGVSGKPFKFVLRKEGEQGFYSDQVIQGKRFASVTPPTYRIVKDESGRFSAMTNRLQGYAHSDLFRDDAGNSSRFRRFGSDRKGWDTLQLDYYSSNSHEPQVFAGPCKVTMIDQLPLDHAPEGSSK